MDNLQQEANPRTPHEYNERLRAARRASFDDVVRPVVKWLNANGHLHMLAIIRVDGAELVEWQIGIPMPEEVAD